MRLVFLLSLAACTGSATVTVDGVAAFGEVGSALWMVVPTVEPWELVVATGEATSRGESVFSPLVIRNYAWSCDSDRAWLSDWAAESDRILTAAEENDEASLCDGITALHALDDRKPAGWHVLSAHMAAGALTDGSPPVATYRESAGGSLKYEVDDGDACRTWDADTCQYAGGDDTCGERDEDLLVELDALVIDDDAGGHVSGTLVGALVDEGGDTVGSVEASFDAALCEYPELGRLIVSVD